MTEGIRVLLLITVFLFEFLTTTVSLRALVITLCVTVLLCILLYFLSTPFHLFSHVSVSLVYLTL